MTGATISSSSDSPNTDGIDIWSSTNVTVSRSSIGDGDDNIALDSSDSPTSHITVVENRIGAGHGLSIGSYTVGGIRDVRFADNSLVGTTTGVRIKTARDRGGEISGVTYDHLAMTNVPTAIGIIAYYPKVPADGDPAQPVTATTPNIHDTVISNVSAVGSDAAAQLVGVPEQPLTAISLQTVNIAATTGLTIRNATVTADDATKIAVQSGQPVMLESNASYNGQTSVPPKTLPDLAAAFNDIGSCRYLTRDSLAAAGLTPGATVKHGAFTFTWPKADAGSNYNVATSPETVLLDGTGTQLGFLGLAAHGNQTGTVTITYSDGTTSSGTIAFSDWCPPPPRRRRGGRERE